MTVRIRTAAGALILGLTCATPALAAGESGFSARGSLTVQTEFQGVKLNVGGNIALEQRGSLVRVDVLSLALPGLNQALNALANGQLFPPGGYSLVYDQAKHSYTVWSPSKHTYYTSESSGEAPAQSNPAAATATTVSNASDILHSFSAAKALRDYRVFSASLNLTGHGTTNGHPSTGVNFAIKRQERTGDLLDLHGSLQLADDLDELPVQIAATVKGAAGAPPTSLKLDLTSVDPRTPDENDFVPPEGYSRASKFSDVLGRSL